MGEIATVPSALLFLFGRCSSRTSFEAGKINAHILILARSPCQGLVRATFCLLPVRVAPSLIGIANFRCPKKYLCHDWYLCVAATNPRTLTLWYIAIVDSQDTAVWQT